MAAIVVVAQVSTAEEPKEPIDLRVAAPEGLEEPILKKNRVIRLRGVPAGLEGEVHLLVTINKRGRVEKKSIQIVQGPPRGHPLAEAAVSSAAAMRYRPARLRGKRVAVLQPLVSYFGPGASSAQDRAAEGAPPSQ